MKIPSPPAESRLLPWLLTALKPMSRTKVKEWLRDGFVVVNGTATTRHDFPITNGDRIEIVPAAREGSARNLTVLYRDDSLIAIDKPAGLLSVATEGEKQDTAFVRLREDLASRREGRPFVVHRLDRETSGVLLFACTESIREKMQSRWDELEKRYLAIVEGVPKTAEGTIDNYLVEMKNLRVKASGESVPGAKRAITRYQLLKTVGEYSLLEVRIETGRKHQIRVHLTGIGCPIIGDDWYGTASDPLKRLGLHAWKLAFDHPVTKDRVEIEAVVPEGWHRLLKSRPDEG